MFYSVAVLGFICFKTPRERYFKRIIDDTIDATYYNQKKGRNMNAKLVLALGVMAAVLCISSRSSAECGWVLWEKTEVIETNVNHNVFWKIQNAYSNYDQCLQAKKRVWQVIKDQAIEEKKQMSTISEIKEVPNELVIKTYKDNKNILSWSDELYCLPGTLDPREKNREP
jgi:hypothetical protein